MVHALRAAAARSAYLLLLQDDPGAEQLLGVYPGLPAVLLWQPANAHSVTTATMIVISRNRSISECLSSVPRHGSSNDCNA
jgi:hypothetical protein